MKFVILCLLAFSACSHAEVINTGRGKIVFTEGHTLPNCRQVSFINNTTGNQTTFRIAEKENTDINSIALTAMIAKKDVEIWYDSNIQSGCGTQPKIYYIRVYSD